MGTVVSDRREDSDSQAPDKYWLVAAVAVFLGLLAWTLLARSPLQVLDAEGVFSAANVVATAPAADTQTVRAESK